MAQGFKSKSPKQLSAKKSRSRAKGACKSEAKTRTEIEAFLEKDQHENSDQYALAWQAGVYNPLAELEAAARFLEPNEEDWLFLAKEVGWLQVEEELDAIYFTALPPFDPEQADWYIRPDLTTFLEEPELLSKVAAERPIPQNLIFEAIERYAQNLGWNAGRTEAFIRGVTDVPIAELSNSDFLIVLLEIRQLDRSEANPKPSSIKHPQ